MTCSLSVLATSSLFSKSLKIFFLSLFAERTTKFITTSAKSIKIARMIKERLQVPKISKHAFENGAPKASPAVLAAEKIPTTLIKLFRTLANGLS